MEYHGQQDECHPRLHSRNTVFAAREEAVPLSSVMAEPTWSPGVILGSTLETSIIDIPETPPQESAERGDVSE